MFKLPIKKRRRKNSWSHETLIGKCCKTKFLKNILLFQKNCTEIAKLFVTDNSNGNRKYYLNTHLKTEESTYFQAVLAE